MVKVASCPRCGNVVSAHWGSVAQCGKCDSAMREVDVDLGPKERYPRYLNWTSMGLLAVITFLFVLTMTGTLDMSPVPLLIVVGLSIALLFISVIYQQRLVKESIERAPSVVRNMRGQRRVRAPAPVRAGPTPKGPPYGSGERDPQRPPLPVKRPISRGEGPERPRKATKIVGGR